METLSIKTELQCENCHKILNKNDVKPVKIGDGSVKPFCAECLSELKSTIKKDKSAYRAYRNNPLFSWRAQILLGFVITAIFGIIYILYELLT